MYEHISDLVSKRNYALYIQNHFKDNSLYKVILSSLQHLLLILVRYVEIY